MESQRSRGEDAAVAADAERLLAVVRALVEELHPGRLAVGGPALGDALDRDLGLDSLGRMELLARLERTFGVRLPEEGLVEAETPACLLRLVAAAAPDSEAVVEAPVLPEAVTEAAPERCRTLLEVLEWHVRRHPQRTHLTFLGAEGAVEELTYEDLDRCSRTVAVGLRDLGLTPGRAVGLMLPSSLEYFACFLGILRAGGVPVPLYPPLRRSQIEDHMLRQAGILAISQAELLITFREVLPLTRLLSARVPGLARVLTAADATAAGEGVLNTPELPTVHGDDTAFLQFTSGSTGDPKGVILSHGDLLANLRIMGRTAGVRPDDRLVSWLPLYHDMGLIGAWMGTLYFGLPLILMSPLSFLARPLRWLQTLHRYQATISAAPNFAYELCLAKIPEQELKGLDLSCWRIAMNGAEPVSAETVRRFTERFAPYGFRPEAMTPVYGLAECALGLAFTPPGRGPYIDRIDRVAFLRDGRAEPVAAGEPDALEVVSCGPPLPGYEVRLVDQSGGEVEPRRQGRLLFRGPSATRGYFRNPEATRDLFCDGWLDTGDLAYVAEGEIYLTGRVKDLILRAGRNVHPQDVEAAVGELPGIRKGCVAVFGVPDPRLGTERVVVLAETREVAPEVRRQLERQVTDAASEPLGGPPDEVVLAPPHAVLKTSSGKIRRSATRQRWQQGELAPRKRAVWRQVARLGWLGLTARLASSVRTVGGWIWAGRFWLVAALTMPLVWGTLALLPGLGRRQRFGRLAARTIVRLLGLPLSVEGQEHLAGPGPRIVVANHASYLDGLLLSAVLPPGGAFVAKRELSEHPFGGVLLGRLGAMFVERFDALQGVEDTRRALAAVAAGTSLIFFPEGTFDWAPGLRGFRLGAFRVAAEAAVPVVPVALTGSRVLLGRDRFPRRGPVEVCITPPLEPAGSDWRDVVALRDAARAAILEGCGEPDLERGR